MFRRRDFAVRWRVCALLEEGNDLIDLGRKQVEGGEDTTVGPQIVLFHNLFVVYAVADIDVGLERNIDYSRVKVEDIGFLLVHVEVIVNALHESCLARAC